MKLLSVVVVVMMMMVVMIMMMVVVTAEVHVKQPTHTKSQPSPTKQEFQGTTQSGLHNDNTENRNVEMKEKATEDRELEERADKGNIKSQMIERSEEMGKEERDDKTQESREKTRVDNIPESGEGKITEVDRGREAENKENKQERRDKVKRESQDKSKTEFKGKKRSGGIVLVSLGWGEDESVMSAMASQLQSYGHDVTVVVYGPRTPSYPHDVLVLEISVQEDDPMFPEGLGKGVTAEETMEGREWAISGRIVRSRVCACQQLNEIMSQAEITQSDQLLKNKEDFIDEEKMGESSMLSLATRMALIKEKLVTATLLVMPLFLHDVCVLHVAEEVGVPVVGVVTSRVGAWWVWHNLGLLPPLSYTPVPPYTMEDLGLWSRASNLASHYGYLTNVRQLWQVPASTSITEPLRTSLRDLYFGLKGILVAWDPLLDPSLPSHPSVIPVGAFNLLPGHMAENVLVSALQNRAGLVTVSLGQSEVWVGSAVHRVVEDALRPSPFTVLWREKKMKEDNMKGDEKMGSKESSAGAQFVYKSGILLSDILNHPRHRLLISSCGEMEVMSAVYFGSPVLCLPVSSDQHLAATQLVRLGLGATISANEVTVEKVKVAVHNLIGDRKYRERGRVLGEEMHDQPLTPDDRLVFTLERVMRKPRSHLYLSRPLPPPLYLLQQGNADVYLLLLLLLTLLAGLLVYLLLTLLPLMLAKTKSKKD